MIGQCLSHVQPATYPAVIKHTAIFQVSERSESEFMFRDFTLADPKPDSGSQTATSFIFIHATWLCVSTLSLELSLENFLLDMMIMTELCSD